MDSLRGQIFASHVVTPRKADIGIVCLTFSICISDCIHTWFEFPGNGRLPSRRMTIPWNRVWTVPTLRLTELHLDRCLLCCASTPPRSIKPKVSICHIEQSLFYLKVRLLLGRRPRLSTSVFARPILSPDGVIMSALASGARPSIIDSCASEKSWHPTSPPQKKKTSPRHPHSMCVFIHLPQSGFIQEN